MYPGYFMGGWMWLFPLLFLGIMLFMFTNKNFKSPCGGISNNDTKEESALDILKKRYAKGEISKEDFKEMKKTLEG